MKPKFKYAHTELCHFIYVGWLHSHVRINRVPYWSFQFGILCRFWYTGFLIQASRSGLRITFNERRDYAE